MSWAHLGGSWGRFGGLWSRLGGVLEALESVLESPDVVLEAMLGQDSPKQAHESENLEKHMENLSFLPSHEGILGVSWKLLEAFWRVFEAS